MSQRLEPLLQRLVLMSPSQAPLPHAINRPSQAINLYAPRQNPPVPTSKSRCPRQEIACTTRKIRRTHEEIANTCRSIANTSQELERQAARERRVRVRKIARRAATKCDGAPTEESERSVFGPRERGLCCPPVVERLKSFRENTNGHESIVSSRDHRMRHLGGTTSVVPQWTPLRQSPDGRDTIDDS
jgi:hypothetical protein